MHALSLLLLAPLQAGAPSEERVDYAVVVHTDNPITALSGERLRRILRAEVQEWPSSDGIELLLPRSGTGEKRVLLDLVYDMSDLQLKRYWTTLIYQNQIVDAPRVVPSNAVALRVVERTSGSIAIVRAADLASTNLVKVVRIDERLPGEKDYSLVLFERQVAEAQPADRPLPANPSEAAFVRAGSQVSPDEDLRGRVARLESLLGTDEGWASDLSPLNLRAFGHMEVEAEEEIVDQVSSENFGFSIESLDLLLTSALTERVSVLAETVFDAQDEGDFKVEVERLLLKVRFADALTVQAGRFLTSLGYWNVRYHHGEWLQTSVDRPEVLDFEDDTGLLPLHNVGISLKGAMYSDVGGIDYALELANGRGSTPGAIQTKVDANDRKAVNASIGLEPAFLPGLRIGGGVYCDDIPPNFDADEGAVHGRLDETITNVLAVYRGADWEIMGEYFWLEHEDRTTAYSNSGWYAQVGRTIGDWTPYLRLDGLERDSQETFWEDPYDAFTWAVGLRYDVIEWAALTLQYEDAEIDVPDGEPNEETRTFVLQASFVL